MAAEYGRALYAQRPISMLMNAEPLVVEGAVGLLVFTRVVLAERPSELLQGLIGQFKLHGNAGQGGLRTSSPQADGQMSMRPDETAFSLMR